MNVEVVKPKKKKTLRQRSCSDGPLVKSMQHEIVVKDYFQGITAAPDAVEEHKTRKEG